MSHWLLDNILDKRNKALKIRTKVKIYNEMEGYNYQLNSSEISLIKEIASALELVVLELSSNSNNNQETLNVIRECAKDAYDLLNILPRSETPIDNAYQLLRISCLSVIGDNSFDASKMLRQESWFSISSFDSWRDKTWATIIDTWLRLIRKQGWQDRDNTLQRISDLRKQQELYENEYLEKLEKSHAEVAALELVGLYHLAKAAETMAVYITDGVVEGNYQIRQLLDTNFERALEVCNHAQLVKLELMVRLLKACANQMVSNSIWTVTRAVNTKVSQFVKTLVDRGRGDKALFDVLPPQRIALAEKGLLGSSRRSVVVSLPTSSGKTMIAQFRILQAINQFEQEQGWIAYLAPTRALVNQVSRDLRRDFESLSVIVEKVSPILDIDVAETNLLEESEELSKFRVLVTTPEKLDLMLRQGWEEKIGRPLTLVVVDEAHNIQDYNRGLKLELLLATINKECKNAQFLLLTPFIENAYEVAKWLGEESSTDISLSVDWQPNDRVIGTVTKVKGKALNKRSFDYELNFRTLHTNKNTLNIDELLIIPKVKEIASTFSKVDSKSSIGSIAAQYLQNRGPVIIIHNKIDWVWSTAQRLKIEENRMKVIDPEIRLLQDYLRLELGESFPLIELLEFGIGVHHSGLPEEVRVLVEYLFEKEKLKFIVATTSIAQGVNFPASGVVMITNKYFTPSGAFEMPTEDFWNIAGRTGRVQHSQLGFVALVADDENEERDLEEYINRQTSSLNSALVKLVLEAQEKLSDLGSVMYNKPQWSSFLQYLAHTYNQMGKPENFNEEVEQILRGTWGFKTLREQNVELTNKLLAGIKNYTTYLQRKGQPLKLVDSTGFSLDSINSILMSKGNIDANSWDSSTLYKADDQTLKDMMGILLSVPELRDNFKEVIGKSNIEGDTLALIIKEWVKGAPVYEIATKFFQKEKYDEVKAITECGKNLFGSLTQTVSWGLSALLAITGGSIDENKMESLSNLPAMAFYGVDSDDAILFRLL
jgi:replicative superfamily II helicase